MIPPFPKIFALGSKQTQGILDGEVEITEKLDGSQIAFGKINGELIIRSKGQRIYPETVDKMFKRAVEVIQEKEHLLMNNAVYYGEYLQKSKHNCLVYGQTPNNHIALYGVFYQENWFNYINIKLEATRLSLDIVPLLCTGVLAGLDHDNLFNELLEKTSYLGKTKIEGIVVKNYDKQLLIGGQVIPILMGKYVSEAFKEVHKKDWNKENTGKGKWDVYKSQFQSEARWRKCVQHLRDSGVLEESPTDIGKLLCELNKDIEAEEKENIKEWLWNEFGKDILRNAGQGLGQWYKERLLNQQEFPIDLGGS